MMVKWPRLTLAQLVFHSATRKMPSTLPRHHQVLLPDGTAAESCPHCLTVVALAPRFITIKRTRRHQAYVCLSCRRRTQTSRRTSAQRAKLIEHLTVTLKPPVRPLSIFGIVKHPGTLVQETTGYRESSLLAASRAKATAALGPVELIAPFFDGK